MSNPFARAKKIKLEALFIKRTKRNNQINSVNNDSNFFKHMLLGLNKYRPFVRLKNGLTLD